MDRQKLIELNMHFSNFTNLIDMTLILLYFLSCPLYLQPTIADFVNVAWWTSAAAWWESSSSNEKQTLLFCTWRDWWIVCIHTNLFTVSLSLFYSHFLSLQVFVSAVYLWPGLSQLVRHRSVQTRHIQSLCYLVFYLSACEVKKNRNISGKAPFFLTRLKWMTLLCVCVCWIWI